VLATPGARFARVPPCRWRMSAADRSSRPVAEPRCGGRCPVRTGHRRGAVRPCGSLSKRQMSRP